MKKMEQGPGFICDEKNLHSGNIMMKATQRTLKYIFLSVLFSVSAMQSGYAQVLDQIKNSFAKYHNQVLQEKLFVHTDKTFYLTGEIIWFKVYNVDASLNKPLDVSKVVYIDVLDNGNAPLLQAKILLKNGVGSGSLYIPVTAVNGNYKLRAYTNWMKNFSADLYFEQAIAIVNPVTSPEPGAAQAKTDNDIRFFPESGNLVNGIKSTVAFKAVGPDGKGVDELSGIVIDQHNDTVARFKSLKFGMGRFSFTPSAGNTYKTIMRIGQNNALIKDLPPVSKDGYVMHLADAGTLELNVHTSIAAEQSSTFYVFAHSGEQVKVAQEIKLSQGSATIAIDKNKLGEGITHITLFNSARQPVCERLYFKRPQAQLQLSAGADQLSYNQRKKVSVDISAANLAGKPQAANLSLSVYRMDSLETNENANIYAYLWLTSELKGTIESPGYYFQNTDNDTNEAIDNLLLTQGWSRFKWEDVLASKAPAFKFVPEYNGHLITGKITDAATGSPVKYAIGYLGATGKRVQLYASTSDQDGRFLFNTKDFYGQNELVLQLNLEKDSVYHLDILSPFSEQFSARQLPPLTFGLNLKNALQLHSIATQAQNIYAGNKIKQYVDPGIDSSAFYGRSPKTYALDEFTRFTTMEEVLREYVSEVNIANTQKHFHIKVLNEEGFLNGDPLVMLDGIPVFDMNRVMAIDPLKVKRLQVVPYRYYWGPTSAEGILSYTSYKGDLGGFEINPHAVVLDYEGMQLQREFYSPVYDTDAQVKSRMPDLRNLLYWSPTVLTNAAGKTRATFYTSDQEGKYIGVLQGLDASGNPGYKYFTFEVKR